MQNRRGFLRTLIGTAVGVATGGFSKIAEALTTKQATQQAVLDLWGDQIAEEAVFTSYVKTLKDACTKMVKEGKIRAFDIAYRSYDADGCPREAKIDLTITPSQPAQFVTVEFDVLPSEEA